MANPTTYRLKSLFKKAVTHPGDYRFFGPVHLAQASRALLAPRGKLKPVWVGMTRALGLEPGFDNTGRPKRRADTNNAHALRLLGVGEGNYTKKPSRVLDDLLVSGLRPSMAVDQFPVPDSLHDLIDVSVDVMDLIIACGPAVSHASRRDDAVTFDVLMDLADVALRAKGTIHPYVSEYPQSTADDGSARPNLLVQALGLPGNDERGKQPNEIWDGLLADSRFEVLGLGGREHYLTMPEPVRPGVLQIKRDHVSLVGGPAVGIVRLPPVLQYLFENPAFTRAYGRLLTRGAVPYAKGDDLKDASKQLRHGGAIFTEQFIRVLDAVSNDVFVVPLGLMVLLGAGMAAARGLALAALHAEPRVDDDGVVIDGEFEEPVVQVGEGVIDVLASMWLLTVTSDVHPIPRRGLDTTVNPSRRIRCLTNEGLNLTFMYDLITGTGQFVTGSAATTRGALQEGGLETGHVIALRESEVTSLMGGSGAGKSTHMVNLIIQMLRERDRLHSMGVDLRIYFASVSEPTSVDSALLTDVDFLDDSLPAAVRMAALVQNELITPLHGVSPFGGPLKALLEAAESAGMTDDNVINVLVIDSSSDLVDEAASVSPEISTASRTGGREPAVRRAFAEQTNALANGGWLVLQSVNLQSGGARKDVVNDIGFASSAHGGSDNLALLDSHHRALLIRDRTASYIHLSPEAIQALEAMSPLDQMLADLLTDAAAGTRDIRTVNDPYFL